MLLGVNTATDALSLAIVEDGRVLAEALRDVGTEHSEAVFELLEAVFAWSGRTRRELRGVGVAIGPGGFTGVRTGISLAKTVAQVLDLPIYGLDTLTALAFQFAGPATVVPMLDARRGLVFAGAYAPDGTVLHAGGLHRLEDWIEVVRGLTGPVLLVGEGASRHRPALREALPTAWIPDDGLMIARAAPLALYAERQLAAGVPADGAALVPLYLREPQAVVNWEAAQQEKAAP